MKSKNEVAKILFLKYWLVGLLFLLTGCQSAYFGAMEKFGVHKRDILVDRVEDARNAQEDAKEQFKSALEKFSSVLGFHGGELQDKYETLNDAFEDSEKKARDVSERIDAVESVAEALFDEWESELSQYSSKNLRQTSQRKLNQTRKQYAKLIGAMQRAEKRIDPVLKVFHDNVLFLKHNLNAKAIASLQSELVSVESNVGRLIRDMERSINEADRFIKTMNKE
ncbi:MAG: DUF2959 domain-containing protein [Gammaproteobacteria bacterium]|nr:DUF2959 domain-containing protein [Gammaproteobacteria bacterium]